MFVTLKNFCEEYNIGRWIIYQNKTYYSFNVNEFRHIFDLNLIVNATNGGLVIGKYHNEGGINMLVEIENAVFICVGEMESHEYLMSPQGTAKHKHLLQAINILTKPYLPNIKTDFNIPSNCKVIKTEKNNISFILLSCYTQFIFNRGATEKNLKKIINLDKNNG